MRQLAVEVSPVLTEEAVGVLVAENLAVDQVGVLFFFFGPERLTFAV